MLFNFRQKEEEKQRKLEEREQLKKYVLPVVLKSRFNFRQKGLEKLQKAEEREELKKYELFADLNHPA